MNSPLNWKIFAGLTLTAWICIAMYAPYYWGETLVQQQQEMQKVEQSRTEREHREQHIDLLRRYFPQRQREWYWSDGGRQFAIVRADHHSQGQLISGEEEIERTVKNIKDDYKRLASTSSPSPDAFSSDPIITTGSRPPIPRARPMMTPEEWEADQKRRGLWELNPVLLRVNVQRTLNLGQMGIELLGVAAVASVVFWRK